MNQLGYIPRTNTDSYSWYRSYFLCRPFILWIIIIRYYGFVLPIPIIDNSRNIDSIQLIARISQVIQEFTHSIQKQIIYSTKQTKIANYELLILWIIYTSDSYGLFMDDHNSKLFYSTISLPVPKIDNLYPAQLELYLYSYTFYMHCILQILYNYKQFILWIIMLILMTMAIN